MNDDLTLVVERLLPVESPEFFEDFWAMAEDREHRSARRWRRIALAATVVAALALTTAVVVAAPFGHRSVVDETMTCRVEGSRGSPIFALTGNPRRPSTANQYAATAALLLTAGGDFFYGKKLLVLDESMQGSSPSAGPCAGRAGPPCRSRAAAFGFAAYSSRACTAATTSSAETCGGSSSTYARR